MYHTCAFAGALAQTANTAIAAVNDDVLTKSPSTGNLFLPEDMSLFAAFAMSATLNRVRLNIPSFRMISLPYIRPIIAAALPSDEVIGQLYIDQPLRLPANEELAVQGTSDLGAGSETANVVFFLGKQLGSIPPGDIYTVRATATTAAVASTWTSLALTLEQNLPPGNYSLLTSEHFSTTAIAHRWIMPNMFYRPGAMSVATVGLRPNFQQNNRLFGEMGRFPNTVIPTCQVLCNAADASHTVYMQLVKVG